MQSTTGEARHNEAQRRYEIEIEVDGGSAMALAEYSLDNGVATFFHTETPPALQGRGVASKLINFALTDARARGWKVRPTCSFVIAYLKRHPEFADLL